MMTLNKKTNSQCLSKGCVRYETNWNICIFRVGININNNVVCPDFDIEIYQRKHLNAKKKNYFEKWTLSHEMIEMNLPLSALYILQKISEVIQISHKFRNGNSIDAWNKFLKRTEELEYERNVKIIFNFFSFLFFLKKRWS